AERTARQAGDIVESWRRFRARTIEVAEFQKLVTSLDEFLEAACTDMEQVRANLAEVVLAQGYQELSGQIIRGGMKLVGELEVALVELVRLSRIDAPAPAQRPAEDTRCGFGPAIPGIDNGSAVSGQQDVDSLLAGLGM